MPYNEKMISTTDSLKKYSQIEQKDMKDVIQELKASLSIIILPHKFIDGDGLCSAMALGLALESFNKKVEIIIEEDEIPNTLNFTSANRLVVKKDQADKNADLVIAIDLGDSERLGNRLDIYQNAFKKLNIDHHVTNSLEADFKLVDKDAAACGEIVYEIIKSMGIQIEKNIAECLYIAIATDTGGFRFSNTTEKTHNIIAELVSTGIDVAFISHRVFDIATYTKIKLMGKTIENMEILNNKTVAFTVIPYDYINALMPSVDDFEGLVNIGRNIDGIEVSVLLRENEPGVFKGSMRTNKYMDAAKISSAFNGGGHKRAAGFSMQGDIKELRDLLLAEISRELLSHERLTRENNDEG